MGIKSKKLKVMIAFDEPRAFTPHATPESFLSVPERKTERDICRALKDLGHEPSLLPVSDDVGFILERINIVKPDIIFNQVEQFNWEAFQERNFVGLLEMLKVPYTGTSVSGLILCKNKAVAKQIIAHHQVRTPEFQTVTLGSKIKISPTMRYPLIIKPLKEDASYGIVHSSLVYDEAAAHKRIRFLFDSMGQDALVEEYIMGREIYASILNVGKNIQVLPCREMVFKNKSTEEHKIATYKAKWDNGYRKKWGITNTYPKSLPASVVEKINALSLRMFQALSLQGYARLDLRLTSDHELVFLEANPNPHLARGEDFAMSAKKVGMTYEGLIQKIVDSGLKAGLNAQS